MSTGMIWLTIGLLVLVGIALVIAAFWDRRRARQIEHDLKEQLKKRPPESRGDRD